MNKEATESLGSAGAAQPAPSNRWPMLCCAAALLWCAWWYCRDASQGLLLLTAGLAAVAAVLPRQAPHTARWVIWLTLLMAVACLAANVTRLVPPEGTQGDARVPDRAVTLLYALGAASLFFRPRTNGVTLVAVAGLPMIMMVVSRDGDAAGVVGRGAALLLIWGFIALAAAADLAQRLASTHHAGRPAPGAREVMLRLVALTGVLALAYALSAPVEQAALYVQKKVFGLVTTTGEGGASRHGNELSLKQPTPSDFLGRMRVLMLIQADHFPGYLRESVFTTYAGGRWLAPKPGAELRQSGPMLVGARQAEYQLGAIGPQETASHWRIEVMAPQLLGGFCLPGSAVALRCEGLPPLADADGAVTPGEAMPDRFEAEVAVRRLAASVYPLPAGTNDPAYLNVPTNLAAAVSNWVACCKGLAGEARVAVAGERVEAYFQTNFTYRLGVALRPAPDPLMDFMKRREGSCTYFASAAALMFRSCGKPARVVAGYVSCGRNPWLNRWVVRERESHAWVEVWDASASRWLLVDPTPACGHPTAQQEPGRVQFAADLLVAVWKRLVVGLKGVGLLMALADMGETLFAFLWHTVWSVAGAVVLAGFAAVWWLRRRSRKRPFTETERLRAELAEAMCKIAQRAVPARLRRRPCEGWDMWLGRIGPEMPASLLAELNEWAESYQVLRYRERLDEAAVRRWITHARRALRGGPRR